MFVLELISTKAEETINVKIASSIAKPVEKLNFAKYIANNSVPISYIESGYVTSEDNLFIQNESWKIKENNPNFLREEEYQTFTSKRFYSNYENLLITNKLQISKQGQEEPLFYKHKRKIKEASLHFVSVGNNSEVTYGYKIEDGYFYTNYKNLYDYKTGNHRLHFINGIDSEGKAFNELLNVEPAFKEASWEDIDVETGELLGNVYTQEEDQGRYVFNINNIENCAEAKQSKYYVKILNQNLLELKEPVDDDLTGSWFVRINNGRFFSNGRSYYVPEYGLQPFYNFYGYLKSIGEKSFIVNKNVLKVKNENIKLSINDNININILVANSEESIIKCVTTDASLLGKKYNKTNLIWEAGIVSCDEEYGFIELDFNLSENQIVFVDYFYKTKDFVFKEEDFNPFKNKQILDKKYFLYLIPNQINKSVYYFICDEDNIIEYSSKKEFKIEIDGNYNENHMVGKSLDLFRGKYCHGKNNIYQWMELGEVLFVDKSEIESLKEIQIKGREAVQKKFKKDLFDRQWKSLQSKYGYGENGQTYQNNNILYIEVPLSLLKQEDQSKEKIERAIKTHLPHYIEVIADYTYAESKLTFEVDSEVSIKVNISWEEQGMYLLYRNTVNKYLDETTSTPIGFFDSSEEEELFFEDTNVESGKKYYYYVKINQNPNSKIYGVEAR